MDDHYTELSLPDTLRLAALAVTRAGLGRRHHDAIQDAADLLELVVGACREPGGAPPAPG